ncbi:hypothetical protein ACSTS3_17005 [Aquimarina muelleri]|uniref:hypothetical protein n=1 Tax=Aquimarina muelleri TaxID=279356 RepID=UPI003F6840C4
MKTKSFFSTILFLCLTMLFLTSCESDNLDEEIYQITPREVEDPGDRGDKD